MPKRSLSQNFLNNPAVAGDLVRAGGIQEGEVAVEIGPGKGVVTRELLRAGARVIAVEKDDELAANLHEKFPAESQSGQLRVVTADILSFHPSDYGLRGAGYKLIGSVPYNITSQIFRYFLENTVRPERMAFIVQKEVAERIVARDKKESLLSLSVKTYGAPRYIKPVKARNFTPQPAVDSAILVVENISGAFFEDGTNEKTFFALVRAGFRSPRKTLANNLSSAEYEREAVARALKNAGLSSSVRAEALSLSEWKALYRALQ